VTNKPFPELSEEFLRFGIVPNRAEKRIGQSFPSIGFDTETLPFRYAEMPEKGVRYNDLLSVQLAGECFRDFYFANFKPGIEWLLKFPKRAYVFAHNLPFDLGAMLGKDYDFFLDSKKTLALDDGTYLTGFVREGVMSFAYFRLWKFFGRSKKKKTVRQLTFFDTGNYFRKRSLESLGKEYFPDRPDLWKFEKPEYLGERLPENEKEWEYFQAYAVQDAVLVRELGKKILAWAEQEGIRPKPTPAGFSSAVFLKNYLKKPLFLGSIDQARLIWKCYYGGRFEPFGRGTFEKVSILDINSLYPYSMAFPLPFWKKDDYRRYSLEEIERDPTIVGWGFGKFSFPEGTVYPCLPVQTSKLFFPLRGWSTATLYEWRFALEMGAEISDFFALGFSPRDSQIDHPLREFVLDHYSRKLELDQIKKRDGDAFPESMKDERDLIKLKLNSLYGKFAERHKEPGEPPKAGRLFYPAFASLITGKSRETIARAIVKYSSIYSDTDSIGTMKKPDKRDLGEELGKFKIEIQGSMTIIKSKQYRTISDSEIDPKTKKPKVKGAFHSFRNPKHFFRALDGIAPWEYRENRFVKNKEARIRGLVPRSILPQKFRIKTDPDEKRIYHKKIPISRILSENTLSDPLPFAPPLKVKEAKPEK
jgi:hypothetical protein